MLSIAFTVLGDDVVARIVDRMIDATSDMSPAFEQIADRLVDANSEQFDTEGAYGSGGWAALSPAYAAWKAKRYPGKPILEATGALKGSLTSRPFGVESVGPHSAEFGTDIPYAIYHQQGTEKMPARPPLQLPESERQAWVRIIQKHIADAGDL